MSRVDETGEILTVPATGNAPALTLRRWLPHDAPAMAAAHDDPAMRRWLMRPISSEDEAREAIARHDEAWADGLRFTFAVIERPADDDAGSEPARPVGSVTIRRLDPRFDVAEVGYWTAAAARGRSVAVRAAGAAMEWATALWTRQELPLRRFELIHTLGNDASCRVAQKLGFAFECEYPPSLKFPEPAHLHVRPWPSA
jgi:RimJ/RimL family protein N-acetyltransferase